MRVAFAPAVDRQGRPAPAEEGQDVADMVMKVRQLEAENADLKQTVLEQAMAMTRGRGA